QRGETDEALHIRQEEQLPVYERLNDVRERAVTMGKIADILQQRGETDEALRIYLEEYLPPMQRLGDLDGVAHARFSCAQLRLKRGGWQQGEHQEIYEELAESFALWRQIQRFDGIAVVGELLGQVLAAVGQTAEAIVVFDAAIAAYTRLGWASKAAGLEEMKRGME
ncbi:MAG: hypothetical protein KDD92_20100, partial [Caldilineaceae bacterium]|nr:hypothetical protein [Caldilineaceae bacterium]